MQQLSISFQIDLAIQTKTKTLANPGFNHAEVISFLVFAFHHAYRKEQECRQWESDQECQETYHLEDFQEVCHHLTAEVSHYALQLCQE